MRSEKYSNKNKGRKRKQKRRLRRRQQQEVVTRGKNEGRIGHKEEEIK